MTNPMPASPAATQASSVVGPRVGAAVIDIIILIVVGGVMTALFGDTSSDDDGFNASLTGVPFVVSLILWLGYYFGMEAFAGGQTVGKKAVKLKVVRLDGTALTPGHVAVRTILRVLDSLPAFYLLGFIVMVASKEKQRIGDMAAGTVVVRV
jgi:uncharacterized RDD family membrane protein YckC